MNANKIVCFWHLYMKHHVSFHFSAIPLFVVVTLHSADVTNPLLVRLETGISSATFAIQERASLSVNPEQIFSLFSLLFSFFFLPLVCLPLIHFREHSARWDVKTSSIWNSLETTLCLESNSLFWDEGLCAHLVELLWLILYCLVAHTSNLVEHIVNIMLE